MNPDTRPLPHRRQAHRTLNWINWGPDPFHQILNGETHASPLILGDGSAWADQGAVTLPLTAREPEPDEQSHDEGLLAEGLLNSVVEVVLQVVQIRGLELAPHKVALLIELVSRYENTKLRAGLGPVDKTSIYLTTDRTLGLLDGAADSPRQ